MSAPVKPGDGLVFDGDEATGRPEQGGRVYEVISLDRIEKGAGSKAIDGGESRTGVELRFGRGAIDLRGLEVGQQVWKTDDPELTRRLRRSFEGPPSRKMGLRLEVVAVAGEPLRFERSDNRRACGLRSNQPTRSAWPIADRRTWNCSRLSLAGWGERSTSSPNIEATIEGRPMVPMSLLNQLRRELVARLDELAAAVPTRTIAPEPVLPTLLEPILAERDRHADGARDHQPRRSSFRCSVGNTDQIEAALALGVSTIYADYQDIKHIRRCGRRSPPRRRARRDLPGDPAHREARRGQPLRFLAKQGADGILVRNAGGMRFCSRARHSVRGGLLAQRGQSRSRSSS